MDLAAQLAALASLPQQVEALQARVAELEARLTVAERRPYSVAEAARALGVCTRTIRRRLKDGSLRSARATDTGKIAVYLDSPTADEVSALVLKSA